MKSRTLLVLVLVSAALQGGCIQEEVRSELILEPDGRLTWNQAITAVRSDDSDPVARAKEEKAWLSEARAYRHPAVRGFDLLGAERVRQELLRERPPMELRIEAEFRSLEDVGRTVLALAGEHGEQSLEIIDGMSRWMLRIETEAASEAFDDLVDEDEMALAALGGDGLVVSLARGRFTEAQGFDLSEDRTRATLAEAPDDDEDGDVVLVLAWDPDA